MRAILGSGPEENPQFLIHQPIYLKATLTPGTECTRKLRMCSIHRHKIRPTMANKQQFMILQSLRTDHTEQCLRPNLLVSIHKPEQSVP